MSTSCDDSGCDGPTERCRPCDSLLRPTRYLPSGSTVSPSAAARCPMEYDIGTLSITSHVPRRHEAMALSTKSEVYAMPLGPNWVCSGPRPTGTSASLINSYFRTGMPSSSPVKSLLRIAVWIFSKLKTVVTPCSLPDPTIHLPFGATSTPWGDLPQGIRWTMRGAFLG